MIITIDGPTASGKSTIARLLAQELGFYYLPTGWLYRAVSYLLVEKCNYTQEMLLHPQEKDLSYCLDPSRLVYNYNQEKGGALFFEGRDITRFLKDYTVDQSVALISPIVKVREMVSHAQRSFAHMHDVVVEGRDSGSVVFPSADFKFFMTADPEVRAKRWIGIQKKRGHTFTLKQALATIEDRDTKDKQRKHSPLVIPDGGIVIDTSQLTIKETISLMVNYIKQ